MSACGTSWHAAPPPPPPLSDATRTRSALPRTALGHFSARDTRRIAFSSFSGATAGDEVMRGPPEVALDATHSARRLLGCSVPRAASTPQFERVPEIAGPLSRVVRYRPRTPQCQTNAGALAGRRLKFVPSERPRVSRRRRSPPGATDRRLAFMFGRGCEQFARLASALLVRRRGCACLLTARRARR